MARARDSPSSRGPPGHVLSLLHRGIHQGDLEAGTFGSRELGALFVRYGVDPAQAVVIEHAIDARDVVLRCEPLTSLDRRVDVVVDTVLAVRVDRSALQQLFTVMAGEPPRLELAAVAHMLVAAVSKWMAKYLAARALAELSWNPGDGAAQIAHIRPLLASAGLTAEVRTARFWSPALEQLTRADAERRCSEAEAVLAYVRLDDLRKELELRDIVEAMEHDYRLSRMARGKELAKAKARLYKIHLREGTDGVWRPRRPRRAKASAQPEAIAIVAVILALALLVAYSLR